MESTVKKILIPIKFRHQSDQLAQFYILIQNKFIFIYIIFIYLYIYIFNIHVYTNTYAHIYTYT